MTESTIGDVGEFGLIGRVVDHGVYPQVIIGPGDDAAVVTAGDGRVVISVDAFVEGVHFRRDWSTAIDVGRKVVAASMADVVAMGARPTSLVVAFSAPADLPAAWAVQCTAGMKEEAGLVGAAIVGGDVTAAPQIVISVTVLGDLDGKAPVTRSGAAPGDVVAIAGRLGWSAAGLAVLSRGFRSPKVLVDAHRQPQPPYEAGIAAAGLATSMIDVSDGLIADARHVAEASEVVIDIERGRLEVPEALASAASAYNLDPLQWVLTGGEDHALLATFTESSQVPAGFTVIGSVTAADAHGPGVRLDGARIQARGGHEHFRSTT